ncbi:uromodulin-like isoform X2 [Dendropsophus ebraccatus]
MKIFGALLVALSAALSVLAVNEQLCGGSVNCNCTLTNYNASVLPPSPSVNCSNGLMTIYISKCQLEKSQFNTTNLSLINSTSPECASQEYLVDGEYDVGFHNPMNSGKCGNNMTINGTHIIYSNILYIFAEQRPVLTRNNATMNLSCAYPLFFPVALNISIKPILATTDLSVPGVSGSFPITMAVYTEPSFTTLVTGDTTLHVEDTVYLQVWIPNLEADKFTVKVTRIYATPGGVSPSDGPTYNLTSGSNGCPDPQYGVGLISVLQNSNSSQSRFAMKVFKITGYDFINLYADVTICTTAACRVVCSQRALGSADTGNVARVSVTLSAEGDLFSGTSDRFSMSWTLVSLISSLLFAKSL